MAGSLRKVLLLIGNCLPVLICFTAAALGLCRAQPKPPRPPGPDPDRTARRLADIRQRVNETKAIDTTAKRALEYSRSYLDKAQTALQSRQVFAADRRIGAADALLHVAEHQDHLRTGPGPKGLPSPQELSDHLQRVHFRIQQADYFLKQSGDVADASFPSWARDFYQLAVRAYDHRDMLAADENAKCAEEVVKALENLAQAASPVPPPPPPGPRPPG
jgi:hypothetical protein